MYKSYMLFSSCSIHGAIRKRVGIVCGVSGCQAVSLVREFLQFFSLEYTLAVFDPEVGCVSAMISVICCIGL